MKKIILTLMIVLSVISLRAQNCYNFTDYVSINSVTATQATLDASTLGGNSITHAYTVFEVDDNMNEAISIINADIQVVDLDVFDPSLQTSFVLSSLTPCTVYGVVVTDDCGLGSNATSLDVSIATTQQILMSDVLYFSTDCGGCTDWSVNSGPAALVGTNTNAFAVPFIPPADNSDIYFIVREVSTGNVVVNCQNPANDESAYAWSLQDCTAYEYLIANCNVCPSNFADYYWTSFTTGACYDCNGASECAVAQPIIDVDSPTAAEVFWPVVDCAEEYRLYWKCTDTPGIDGGWNYEVLTVPYFYISGLDPLCILEVKVLTKCSSNGVVDFSEFSPIISERVSGYPVDFEDFNDWGIYNDYGSDCWRITNSTVCASGTKCLALRDNTSTSRTRTDALDICGTNMISLDFTLRFASMNLNKGLKVQFWNGSQWFLLDYIVMDNNDYVNDAFYNETFILDAATYGGGSVFGPSCKLQFRSFGTTNSRRTYIDDVRIESSSPPSCRSASDLDSTNEIDKEELIIRAELLNDPLKVYPNPASDFIKLEVPFGEEINTINVYDLSGTLVKQYAENSKFGSYDISALTDGMYILQVQTDVSTYNTKFLVKK